jgi:hypothetical protein
MRHLAVWVFIGLDCWMWVRVWAFMGSFEAACKREMRPYRAAKRARYISNWIHVGRHNNWSYWSE